MSLTRLRKSLYQLGRVFMIWLTLKSSNFMNQEVGKPSTLATTVESPPSQPWNPYSPADMPLPNILSPPLYIYLQQWRRKSLFSTNRHPRKPSKRKRYTSQRSQSLCSGTIIREKSWYLDVWATGFRWAVVGGGAREGVFDQIEVWYHGGFCNGFVRRYIGHWIEFSDVEIWLSLACEI